MNELVMNALNLNFFISKQFYERYTYLLHTSVRGFILTRPIFLISLVERYLYLHEKNKLGIPRKKKTFLCVL